MIEEVDLAAMEKRARQNRHNMHNDVLALVAEVRRLRAEIKCLQEVTDPIKLRKVRG